MRKWIIALITALLLIIFLILGCYFGRSRLFAHYLAKEFKVPVALSSFQVTGGQCALSNLWFGTPSKSHTKTSFRCDQIDIDTAIRRILSSPLTIDAIEMQNIFVGVEMYGAKDSNWSRMLRHTREKRSSLGRDYVIHKLVLRNLTVEVVQANGTLKRYPTIEYMEFYDITNATGFPISEIEKAIFDLVMKEIFRKLHLGPLLDLVPGANPIRYIPFLH